MIAELMLTSSMLALQVMGGMVDQASTAATGQEAQSTATTPPSGQAAPAPQPIEQLSTSTAREAAAPQAAVGTTVTDTVTDSGDIIVTATRRNARLQDVPVSITAFNQATLTKNGIVGYEGLARQTPSIVYNKPTANFGNFTARGIATNSYGAQLQSTVAIYMDELPISTTGSNLVLDPSLFDVERVEFLRGPQGTLFGSGSLSGALRILTKSPDLTKPDVSGEADLGLTYSDSFRQRYNAMVNLPVVDEKLGLRVVGFYRHEEGYVDNIGTGLENANTLRDWGGRAILLFKPTEQLSVRLLASYENSRPKDSGLINPALGDQVRSTIRPDVFAVRQANYNATIDYQFGFAHLTSSSTLARYHSTFNVDLANVFGGTVPYAETYFSTQDSFTEEARLASNPGSRFEWVAGLFYLQRNRSQDNRFISTSAFLADRGITGAMGMNGETIEIFRSKLKTHELAGFGEATYHLTDDLWATGGIRYGRTDARTSVVGGFNTDYILAALLNRRGPLTIIPYAPATQPKSVARKPSYKGSLSWRPTPSLTTYATVATGYRAPLQNANAGQVSIVDPSDIVIPDGARSDRLTNYEIGAKGRFLDGRLAANVSLYYITWRNIEVVANRVSDQNQFATNIGGARSRGVELELTASPIPALSFGANGSYGTTKINKLSATEASISGAVLGDRLSAPKFQGSVFAQFDFDLGATHGFLNATLQHVGAYPNSLRNAPGQPGVTSPGYGFTDAYEALALTANLRKGKYSLSVYAENLLDDRSTIYLHPETFINARVATLRPRTVGVRLGYNL